MTISMISPLPHFNARRRRLLTGSISFDGSPNMRLMTTTRSSFHLLSGGQREEGNRNIWKRTKPGVRDLARLVPSPPSRSHVFYSMSLHVDDHVPLAAKALDWERVYDLAINQRANKCMTLASSSINKCMASFQFNYYCCCSAVLEKLLEELTPSPEIHFGKTDEAGRTVLHLALLHRMPQQFILFLMDNATQSPLAIDCEDEEKLRPIDYLVCM